MMILCAFVHKQVVPGSQIATRTRGQPSKTRQMRCAEIG
jgi:hypothetical protein